jgi:hypothetical protein
MVKSYFREKNRFWLSVTLLVLQFRFYKYKVKPYAKKEYINHDKYPVKVNMFFELRQWWHNKFFSALNPDPTYHGDGNEYSTHDLFYKMEFTADEIFKRIL